MRTLILAAGLCLGTLGMPAAWGQAEWAEGGPVAVEPAARRWLARLPDEQRRRLEAGLGRLPVEFRPGAWTPGGDVPRFAGLRGRPVVVLAVDATEGRSLQDASRDAGPLAEAGAAVVIVGLAPADEGESDAAERSKRFRAHFGAAAEGVWPVHEAGGATARDLGFTGPGQNLLIDRRGVIRFAGLHVRGLREAVALLVAEEETGLPSPPPPTVEGLAEATAQAEEVAARVAAALGAGGVRGLAEGEKALGELWGLDRALAGQASLNLLNSADPAVRPLGAQLIARHASAAEHAAILRGLPANARDERRWLTRTLGPKLRPTPGKAGDEPTPPDAAGVALLEQLLKDRDRDVRQAAILAAADTEDPRWLALLPDRLPEAPWMTSYDGDEGDREAFAIWGAIETLGGVRAVDARAARDLLLAARGRAGVPEGGHMPPGTRVRVRGNELTASRRVLFGRGPGYQSGALGEAFGRALDEAVEIGAAGAAPVFGRVHFPPFPVYVTSESGLSAAGIPSGSGGLSKGNEVYVRGDLAAKSLEMTMAHEFVHMVHSATFERQPRWLSEGLANSLSLSATRPAARQRAGHVADWVADGLATRVAAWDGGPASGGREGQLYAAAHVLLDFLRFGGFSAPEARLYFLMNRVHNGEHPSRAFETTYGMKLREMDEAVRAWLRSS